MLGNVATERARSCKNSAGFCNDMSSKNDFAYRYGAHVRAPCTFTAPKSFLEAISLQNRPENLQVVTDTASKRELQVAPFGQRSAFDQTL